MKVNDVTWAIWKRLIKEPEFEDVDPRAFVLLQQAVREVLGRHLFAEGLVQRLAEGLLCILMELTGGTMIPVPREPLVEQALKESWVRRIHGSDSGVMETEDAVAHGAPA